MNTLLFDTLNHIETFLNNLHKINFMSYLDEKIHKKYIEFKNCNHNCNKIKQQLININIMLLSVLDLHFMKFIKIYIF